jgi:hypothetical protein
MAAMAHAPKDPLAATDRLLVDGTNLLHAMSRAADRTPVAAVIARLRGLAPGDIAIELVFDGPAERNLRGERIAPGITVRYSGPRTGDELLLSLVDEVRAQGGLDATGRILVVSDDRELAFGLRQRGARMAGTAWLIGRLERGRLAGPRRSSRGSSIGAGRPPAAIGRPTRGLLGRPAPGGRGRANVTPGHAANAGRAAGAGRARTPDGPAPETDSRSSANPRPATDPRLMDAGPPVPSPEANGDTDERPGWNPGRGATAKRGNARRSPRASRPNREP